MGIVNHRVTKRSSKMNTLFLYISIGVLCLTLFQSDLFANSKYKTNFMGWMDTDFRASTKEGNKPYIDAHHLYLIWDSKLDKKYRVYAEVEIEHSPNTSDNKGTIKLERLYSEISINDGINLRLGKFSTPFGYWTPTHWAVLVETVLKPIHEENRYIPAKSVGAELVGRLFIGNNDIEWNAFISNGSEIEGTNKPEDRAFGGGADVRINLLDGDAFLGSSFYKQNNPANEGRDETSFAGYAGMLYSNFDLKAEVISQKRGNGNNGTLYKDVNTFYLSARYFILQEFALGSRWDSGDDDKMGAGDKHQAITIFANWMPIPQAMGKIEYTTHKFDDFNSEDYKSWALYFGLMF